MVNYRLSLFDFPADALALWDGTLRADFVYPVGFAMTNEFPIVALLMTARPTSLLLFSPEVRTDAGIPDPFFRKQPSRPDPAAFRTPLPAL